MKISLIFLTAFIVLKGNAKIPSINNCLTLPQRGNAALPKRRNSKMKMYQNVCTSKSVGIREKIKKRLVKPVGLRLAKTLCGAPIM